MIFHLNQVKDFIHLSRDKCGDNFYLFPHEDLDSQAFLGIQANAFKPVYSEGEHLSDSEDSDLEGNSDSERLETQTGVDVKICVSV